MPSDDEDWPLSVESVDINRYKMEQDSFSDAIAQGQRVFNLRNLAGLAPHELASQADMSLYDLLAIESGLMILSESQALKLSIALRVNQDEL